MRSPRVVALQNTVMTGCELTAQALIVDIRPTWFTGRCSLCLRECCRQRLQRPQLRARAAAL